MSEKGERGAPESKEGQTGVDRVVPSMYVVAGRVGESRGQGRETGFGHRLACVRAKRSGERKRWKKERPRERGEERRERVRRENRLH